MPGPETLAAPAPDEGVPQSDTKSTAEQQAAGPVPVEQAKAVVAAKQAEVIAQEATKQAKPFITSSELPAVAETQSPAPADKQEGSQPNARSLGKTGGAAALQAAFLQPTPAVEAPAALTGPAFKPDTFEPGKQYEPATLEANKQYWEKHSITSWHEAYDTAMAAGKTAAEARDVADVNPNYRQDVSAMLQWAGEQGPKGGRPGSEARKAEAARADGQAEIGTEKLDSAVVARAVANNTIETDTSTESKDAGSAQERFNTLQQDLVATMAEKGVSVAMYRSANEIRADYTDKNGKRIGLETIQQLFGTEMPKVAALVGTMESLAYTNPELFAARETASEQVARVVSSSVDRLGNAMRSKADQLKPKGLWPTARQWFNRGKDKVAAIRAGYQAKAAEAQRQRSEKRVTASFQKFANTFNLLTPAMLSADKAMVGLNRDIDGKSQEFIEASDTVSQLSEEIRRLKVMEARLGRMKEIRGLEKRRDTFQKQVNMLRGQLAKLSTNYNTVDQELKRQQALEQQSLADQLRAKNPLKPGYVGPEIPDRAPATAPAAPEAATPPPTPEVQSGEAA